MKKLNPLHKYGKLTDRAQQDLLYQLTGQQLGLEYRCELVVTDFQGQGWHSTFSLEDVLESMVSQGTGLLQQRLPAPSEAGLV